MNAYAMLEPYTFDPELPAPWNIAGAGFVIGHELGHGFEKTGTKRDVRGGDYSKKKTCNFDFRFQK